MSFDVVVKGGGSGDIPPALAHRIAQVARKAHARSLAGMDARAAAALPAPETREVARALLLAGLEAALTAAEVALDIPPPGGGA